MYIEKWNPTAVIRRFGLAGFSFFFAKGMLWLGLPVLARFLWPA
jgi:hypothetical protein